MAQLNHVSEQTLRLYDREGLLKAQEVDSESGYRYYHILQSARIDLIQNMKRYGLTLKQIRDMLENARKLLAYIGDYGVSDCWRLSVQRMG